MPRHGRSSWGFIDIIGGSTVASCLAGFVWVIAVYNSQTTERIDQLCQAVQDGHRDLRRLQTAQADKDQTVRQRIAELAKTGQLPEHAPVEEYFQTLSRLALAHGLRVVRQNPLGARTYPGMLEERYAYQVTGAAIDIVGFLRAIEQTDFWADVSYLKLTRGNGAEEQVADARVAELTLSLFSALAADESDDGGGA